MGEQIKQLLQPIADWFSGLGTPEPIVHWGHPLMMGIVVLFMGTSVGLSGWRVRVAADASVLEESKSGHRKLAPWLFLFIALGYSGGILSLIMQGQPIFASPHFWTGSTAVVLLGLNGFISLTGFAGNSASLRTAHAYLGSFALLVLLVHAILGVKLGLSLGT